MDHCWLAAGTWWHRASGC